MKYEPRRHNAVDTIATPTDLPASVICTLLIDVYGDGSWNSLYLIIRDATGEILYYPVAAVGWKGWKTVTVDLSKAPSAHAMGNNDGVLDHARRRIA